MRKYPRIYGYACAATFSYTLAALGRLQDPRVIALLIVFVVSTFFLEKQVLATTDGLSSRVLPGALVLALAWFPQFALIVLVRAILDGEASAPNRLPEVWFSVYEWLFLISGAFTTAWIDIGVRQRKPDD